MTSGSRYRSHVKRRKWMIVLVCMVGIFLIIVYTYLSKSSVACNLFSSSSCSVEVLPSTPVRELTDEETAAQVVISEILHTPPLQPKIPKVAFMFLTPGPLPFERLWDMFFHGHEDKFTVYVHASREQPVHVSRYFASRNIHSEKVVWGRISMIDAERRLLANALKDPDNQQFVLLSDSCVPLHNFDYVYNFLIFANVSFLDVWEDPGPHGAGRYSEHMLPEVEKKYFRKGSQWFTLKRQHAVLVTADHLYYTKFKHYCRSPDNLIDCEVLIHQPGMEGNRNCYSDEHYLPTLFKMFDPNGITGWSVTFVDWSEMKWHPRSFRAQDVTFELLKTMTSIETSVHITSISESSFLYAEKGIDKTLHMERNEAALLPVWEEVLP
uniref:Glycosyltransferase n=1 Tax=Daucus carota subsp. sativus TaxID=79200 RepID=A0A165ZS46_DAUCS